MPMTDEERLDEDFEELRGWLGRTDSLNPAHSDPIFYFVFSPRQILTVRRLLPTWIARLRNQNGLTVETLSLSEVMWKLLDESGRWSSWLEVEEDAEQHELNQAVSDVLQTGNALVEQVARRAMTERPNTILFVLDLEVLHPFFRSRAIESYLNNKVRVPTVFFYPGRRVGQYGLHFLDFYSEDAGYRSTITGGQR